MVYQNYPKTKRKRLSTSGSYHSAVEESDYENDINIDELEEEEEELLLSTKSFGEDPQLVKSDKYRSFFTIAFLSGIIVALIAVIVIDYVKQGFSRYPQTHFELIPHLDIHEGISPFASDENWTKTQLVKQKESSVTKTHGVKTSEGATAEALKSLSAALILKKRNHFQKAKKVFLHALALSPKNSEILNKFGEFIEETEKDVLEADGMYTRALLYSDAETEQHTRALQNRKRTAVLVDQIDSNVLKIIDKKKASLQRINTKNAAYRRAKEEAYIQHVHHTVAIEGNTLTLVQTRSILETRLAVGGKSVIEHNEVLGLDAALKYINQTLVDRLSGEIRMQDIVEIHRRVIGYSDPLEAGMFRRTQVFVGDHIPPHADHIEVLMKSFISWLNSPEAIGMHPVRLAALAHYKLVYIHPFVDGNGRTSRLLMNLILMQHGFPPVIIRKQDRLQYYQHLVTANDGDIRPFIRFIARSTERTIDAYLLATRENSIVTFSMDDSETILPQGRGSDYSGQSMLEYHDKIIMGGTIGENISVEP